jgi:hypothetical protein
MSAGGLQDSNSVRKSSRHPYDSERAGGWQITGDRPKSVSELRQIVEKYLALAGGFGPAVPLESFGFGASETARIFSAFDEDYQVSRYLKFSRQSGAEFSINGFSQTHVALDAGIESLL